MTNAESNRNGADSETPKAPRRSPWVIVGVVVALLLVAGLVAIPRIYYSSGVFKDRVAQAVGELFREGESVPIVIIGATRPHGLLGVEFVKIDIRRDYPPFAAISLPSARAIPGFVPAIFFGSIDITLQVELENTGDVVLGARLPLRKAMTPARLKWVDFARLAVRMNRLDVARYGGFLKAEAKKKGAAQPVPRLEDGVASGEFKMERKRGEGDPSGEGMFTVSSMLFTNEDADARTLTIKTFAVRVVVQGDRLNLEPRIDVRTSVGDLSLEGQADLSRDRVFAAPIEIGLRTDGDERLNRFLSRLLNCDPALKKSVFRVRGTISRRRCDNPK